MTCGEDWSMPGVREQASPGERQHDLLTADFVASGIDTRRFGFYDQSAFLARESANPSYVDHYGEWVMTRPICAQYEAHVRGTVPKLTRLLAKAFASYDARGRCISASCMMTRMLDRLGVWSFGVHGSVILKAPALGLRREMQTIALKPGPLKITGHAWTCAPPFLVVDPSLALQHCDPAFARLIPETVLAEASARRFYPSVEDCVSEPVRALFASAEGWRDPCLHHRLDPGLAGLWRTFPAREFAASGLRMRFVPVAIRQPAQSLAHIELDAEGRTGMTVWNSVVAPAFGMAPLSYEW